MFNFLAQHQQTITWIVGTITLLGLPKAAVAVWNWWTGNKKESKAETREERKEARQDRETWIAELRQDNKLLEEKIDRTEAKYEARVVALEAAIEAERLRHKAELAAKDAKIIELEGRIDVLEAELEKTKLTTKKIDEAESNLHQAVADGINHIKPNV